MRNPSKYKENAQLMSHVFCFHLTAIQKSITNKSRRVYSFCFSFYPTLSIVFFFQKLPCHTSPYSLLQNWHNLRIYIFSILLCFSNAIFTYSAILSSCCAQLGPSYHHFAFSLSFKFFLSQTPLFITNCSSSLKSNASLKYFS